MSSTTDAIAQSLLEAQTKAECEEIYQGNCVDYSATMLNAIANKLKQDLAGAIAPELTSELPVGKGKTSITVHHGEYLIRVRARELESARQKNDRKKRETSQSEGKKPLPLDFMRLFQHVEPFKKWDWRAKAIAVRLYTGRRIGEVLYRSEFEEYSEYSVKVTRLSKVTEDRLNSSAIVPTLIPASEVVELVESLRDEWHNDATLAGHWQAYLKDLADRGLKVAGENIKGDIQGRVSEFFDQYVKPAFPELSGNDEEKNGHTLRGVYGCLLYRLLGGHDDAINSEQYMQKCLVHFSGETTQKYRGYNLINFESILELHPGLSKMLFLKNVGWMEYEDEIAAFNIEALASQINDPMAKARLYEAIALKNPTALGEAIGAILSQSLMIQNGAMKRIESGKVSKASEASANVVDIRAAKPASTTSDSALKIQAIVDAVFTYNEMTDAEIVPNTTLIKDLYAALYSKNVNLGTCRAILDLEHNQARVAGLSTKDNRLVKVDKMKQIQQEILNQHGKAL